MTLTINTDGGSRGNPGEAAIGVVVSGDGKLITELKQTIGRATNNEAEYSAVLFSLEWVLSEVDQLRPSQVIWRLDSQLVVEQLSKRWKIKEPRMRELAQKCWTQLGLLPCPYSFTYVPRSENAAADALVNQALDEKKPKTVLRF